MHNYVVKYLTKCRRFVKIIFSGQTNLSATLGVIMETVSNNESFVSAVAEAVLSGRWQPGQRLPAERELAAIYGISKTAVHSGLTRLVSAGLLTSRPQSGTFVADYMLTGGIETLTAIAKYSGDNISPDLISAMLDLRLAIEGMAFRCLGDTITEAGAQRLRAMADAAFAADSSDREHLAELFFEWHREVCLQSRSHMLLLIMNSMHDLSIVFWKKYFVVYGPGNAVARLYSFTSLLEQGDGDGAYRLLVTGIREYLISINGILPTNNHKLQEGI